jgi:hypothetical protein
LHKYLSSNDILTTRLAKRYMTFWTIKINWNVAKFWDEISPLNDKVDIDYKKYIIEDAKEKEKKEKERKEREDKWL